MSRKTYLLVHGAWHGGWCWRSVVPRLQEAGHRALAPSLEGGTNESWVDEVCGLLAAEPGRVVLVGHSRAGIVISQAAERLPQKISSLVYVGAFLLRAHESVLRVLREEGTSPLLKHARLSVDKSEWILEEREIHGLFHGECTEEDAEFARLRLVSEPAAPMMTPVRVTDENFGSVHRVYVETLRDRAVPLSLQRKMHAALPCGRVLSVGSDHSPFFSATEELAMRLLEI